MKKEKEIKSIEEVVIGELAYENPDAGGQWDIVEGIIIWKGTEGELHNSKFASLLDDDWNECLEDIDEELFFVVVKDEVYGNTLFLYNYDPSSVVCFK